MVTRKNRTLENPTGLGEVWGEDEKLAKVRYSLNVQQEILIAKTDEIEGLKSMTGSISVIEGEKMLWGKDKLALHMRDGRKVEFFIKRGDPVSGNFVIQPSGDFY